MDMPIHESLTQFEKLGQWFTKKTQLLYLCDNFVGENRSVMETRNALHHTSW